MYLEVVQSWIEQDHSENFYEFQLFDAAVRESKTSVRKSAINGKSSVSTTTLQNLTVITFTVYNTIPINLKRSHTDRSIHAHVLTRCQLQYLSRITPGEPKT